MHLRQKISNILTLFEEETLRVVLNFHAQEVGEGSKVFEGKLRGERRDKGGEHCLVITCDDDVVYIHEQVELVDDSIGRSKNEQRSIRH